MPIYEYQCGACEQRFEHFVRPSRTEAAAEPHCPHCQSRDLTRLLSAFAVNSDGTRQTHLQQARRKNAPMARDKKHAEIELIQRIEAEHDHDH
jgi:putative FmdB family regulatory protein